ncbi:enolase-phosphatase E1 [Batrachochytrium dendrobatidis]
MNTPAKPIEHTARLTRSFSKKLKDQNTANGSTAEPLIKTPLKRTPRSLKEKASKNTVEMVVPTTTSIAIAASAEEPTSGVSDSFACDTADTVDKATETTAQVIHDAATQQIATVEAVVAAVSKDESSVIVAGTTTDEALEQSTLETDTETLCGKKRSISETEPLAYSAVVLDIEGTTTPISFVHDVLFPHVVTSIDTFLSEKWDDVECQERVADLVKQSEADVEAGLKDARQILSSTTDRTEAQKSVSDYVKWVMSSDRKVTALKAFQGYLWRSAYEIGDVSGVVYDDAFEALKQWKQQGVPVYIYSSGSVEAQKLLFKYSDKGNMLEYFSGHYDTTTGSKIDPESYRLIANDILQEPSQILFVSDNVKEIEAAYATGYQVCIAVRPGNVPISGSVEEKFNISSDFTLLVNGIKSEIGENNGHSAKIARVETVKMDK